MKFAIGSDFHLDINQNHPFELTSDKDAFYICCGDTSGEPEFRDKWLEGQAKHGYHGAFILGNHQVYHMFVKTIQDMHTELRAKFNDYAHGFKFLENDSIYFLEENILLIGCTLWTDFMADGDTTISGNIAQFQMNDYGWKCFMDSDEIRKLRWQDTIAFHNKSMEYIRKTIAEYKQKQPGIKIVLMTHHAPSRKSEDMRFMNSILNPAFISNLENFILDNPEIKLWAHGHLHNSCDYMIGECRVICNPRGYISHGEETEFNPNLIVEI